MTGYAPINHSRSEWVADYEELQEYKDGTRADIPHQLRADDKIGKTRVGVAQTACYLQTTSECGTGHFGIAAIGTHFARLLATQEELMIEVDPTTCAIGPIQDATAWFQKPSHHHLPNYLKDRTAKLTYLDHLKAAVRVKRNIKVGDCARKVGLTLGNATSMSEAARLPSDAGIASTVVSIACGLETPKKRKARSSLDIPTTVIRPRREEAGDDREDEADSSAWTPLGKRHREAAKTKVSSSAEASSSKHPAAEPILLPAEDFEPGDIIERDPLPLQLGADAHNYKPQSQPATDDNLEVWCKMECDSLDSLLDEDETTRG